MRTTVPLDSHYPKVFAAARELIDKADVVLQHLQTHCMFIQLISAKWIGRDLLPKTWKSKFLKLTGAARSTVAERSCASSLLGAKLVPIPFIEPIFKEFNDIRTKFMKHASELCTQKEYDKLIEGIRTNLKEQADEALLRVPPLNDLATRFDMRLAIVPLTHVWPLQHKSEDWKYAHEPLANGICTTLANTLAEPRRLLSRILDSYVDAAGARDHWIGLGTKAGFRSYLERYVKGWSFVTDDDTLEQLSMLIKELKKINEKELKNNHVIAQPISNLAFGIRRRILSEDIMIEGLEKFKQLAGI